MSPLGRFVLHIMRQGAIFCAAALGVYLAANAWSGWFAAGADGMDRGELIGAAPILAFFLGALWLIRAIGREIASNPDR